MLFFAAPPKNHRIYLFSLNISTFTALKSMLFELQMTTIEYLVVFKTKNSFKMLPITVLGAETDDRLWEIIDPHTHQWVIV